ncbi:Cytochrome P450 - like 10 [Theobroma cacao]|nr:Cytochrome P450 - like 10 [Theobroma cacao]
MSLRLGFRSTLVVSSAKMAKEVMKTHDLDFYSRPTLSYNGLDLTFSPYNAQWREVRKICVVHLFNSNKPQFYRPIQEDEVTRLITKISKLFIDSKPVNLSEATMCLTCTIICRIGFSKRYEEEGAERSRFHELLNESQALTTACFISDYFSYMDWNVFIAGTDTSAATMIWVMAFLIKKS